MTQVDHGACGGCDKDCPVIKLGDAPPRPPAPPSRVDSVLSHPVVGVLVLLAVLWTVFTLATTGTGPLQSLLSGAVDGPVRDGADATLGAVGLGDSWVADLVDDGIIPGLSQLLGFLPVIAVTGSLFRILDTTGYLARAARALEVTLRRVGLSSEVAVPLLVGLGCTVPAIQALHAVGSRRARIVATIAAPLMTCSARLTVYLFIANAFFTSHVGTIVLGLYVLSGVLAVTAAAVVGRVVERRRGLVPGVDALVAPLPAWRAPGLADIAAQGGVLSQRFLKSAAGPVLIVMTIIWLLTAMPAGGGRLGDVPEGDSAYDRLTKGVAVVLTPTGFGDADTAGSLVAGIVAKETIVTSMAQAHPNASDLSAEVRTDFSDSSGGHPDAAALAFLVFVLAYTPCLSTIGAQRTHLRTRVVLMSAFAYAVAAWALAVVVFQTTRLFL